MTKARKGTFSTCRYQRYRTCRMYEGCLWIRLENMIIEALMESDRVIRGQVTRVSAVRGQVQSRVLSDVIGKAQNPIWESRWPKLKPTT